MRANSASRCPTRAAIRSALSMSRGTGVINRNKGARHETEDGGKLAVRDPAALALVDQLPDRGSVDAGRLRAAAEGVQGAELFGRAAVPDHRLHRRLAEAAGT